mgnify:FL=1
MPAKECENGKWKWGETGACKYDSKEEAEKDNENYYRDLEDIDLTPTKGMVEAAKRGLELRKEFGRGGTEVGVKTARMIIANELTIPRVKKMYAYFQRHEVDKQAEGFELGEDGFPSAGKIAWMLWGDDAGMSWSTKKRNQIEKEEKEERVSAKIKKALEKKMKDHNEEVSDMNIDWNAKVSLKTLEKVFDRGVGAYNTNPSSVRPSVSSPEQWALARCNSFLYALKKGKFRSGKHDTDLLPSNHPVVEKMKEDKNLRARVGSMITDGIELPLYDSKEEAEKMAEELGGEPSFHTHILDDKEVYMPFENHEEALKVMGKPEDEEMEMEMEDEMVEEEVENNHHYEDEEEERKQITNIWDKKYNDIMEKRIYNLETRVETTENNKDVVVGYGSVFNSRSENLGGFFEFISPTAITDETIKNSDVRALINHNPDLILARSKFGEGNLNLSIDETGLKYSYELPDTTYGRDLGVNLKNGNISQSSFAFTIAEGGDSWTTDENGNDIRTINKIDRLFDISSVTYPAYSAASSDLVIAQRGLQKYKESIKRKDEENDLVKRSLAKLKIEIAKRK